MNNNYREDERVGYATIILVIFLLALLSALFIIKAKDSRVDISGGVKWNGEQEIANYEPTKYITIPGFYMFYFKADETLQQVNLYNPEQNECYMDMTLELKDGTVLWLGNNIMPGYGFYEIELLTTLPQGQYDALFHVDCYKLDDGQQVNGGVIECKIIVN